jgi:hypothetical protein
VKRLATLVVLAGGMFCLIQATAIQVPAALHVANQPLEAASCASRDTLWIHHYVAALYVPPRDKPLAALEDPRKPKALLVQILSRAFLPRDLPPKWTKTLERELDAAQLERVRAAWRTLSVGDRVMVAYAPGRGVTLDLNERTVALAPEHKLVRALLETWADGQPVANRVNSTVAMHPCP